MLLDKLRWVSFELLLAGQATKMISYAIVGDFELSRLFVKNDAANWIFGHYFSLNLI